MKKILIAKPSNNIYLENREDQTKTDLQSGEIIAFSMAILGNIASCDYPNVEIHFANDLGTCINNNHYSANQRRNFLPHNPFIKQFYLYGNEKISKQLDDSGFDESSILFVFCGILNDSEMCMDLLKLVTMFKGRVFYVLNDLRLDIPQQYVEIFKFADATVLTQARTYTHEHLPTRVMDFEMLPLWYVNNDGDALKKYDICYPILNFKDLGTYRKEILHKLHKVDDVKVLWIGDKPEWLGNNNYYCEKKKYDQLHNTVKMCKASFIVNEEIYNQNQLIPNRFFEALMLGVIPVFHRETAEALEKHINIDGFYIYDYVVNDDFSNLSEIVNNYELLWKTQEIGKRFKHDTQFRINITQNFDSQILTLIDEH